MVKVLLLGIAMSMLGANGQGDVPPEARREIDAANAAWIPAMQREDAATVAAPYADDGVFVGADGRTFVGRAGVEALMRERFKATRVRGGTITQDGLRMEGALVYEWGHATLELESATGPTTSKGRYLTVWNRDADGRWRIWRNLSLPQ